MRSITLRKKSQNSKKIWRIWKNKAELAKEDAEKLKPEIEALQAEFTDRKKELTAVNKEHEDEELKLQHQREKVRQPYIESRLPDVRSNP